MRLKIIETNFSKKYEWLFKLSNEQNDEFFIMQDFFYKKHNLKTPITKKELDYYEVGTSINAAIKEIEGTNVVV